MGPVNVTKILDANVLKSLERVRAIKPKQMGGEIKQLIILEHTAQDLLSRLADIFSVS